MPPKVKCEEATDCLPIAPKHLPPNYGWTEERLPDCYKFDKQSGIGAVSKCDLIELGRRGLVAGRPKSHPIKLKTGRKPLPTDFEGDPN